MVQILNMAFTFGGRNHLVSPIHYADNLNHKSPFIFHPKDTSKFEHYQVVIRQSVFGAVSQECSLDSDIERTLDKVRTNFIPVPPPIQMVMCSILVG